MTISIEKIEEFKRKLISDEKSKATAEQYARRIAAMRNALDGQELTRESVLEYKELLKQKYAPASVNAAIAAINSFLDYIGMHEHKLKNVKIQRKVYADSGRELKKEEYKSLLAAAGGKPRLSMILQTLVSTGIRISELKFITTEAIERGIAEIDCKGKHRTVFIPQKLCRMLKKYANKLKIKMGSIFITKNGNPVDRSNLAKELKKLAEAAKVAKEKVFPHNFRHLFARIFYSAYKDIVRLSDILGHSSINTTRIYTRESGEVHRRQIDDLMRKLAV
ncbi:MAG: tyrosine-type recombinase/integrase [Clostridia bacterium]|nr:tyrosine-type recombinase/integrase [Clostridia bacterium]